MKFLVKSLFIISSLLLTQQLKAEESYSFGVGLGATYSGLGVNMSMLTDSDMKYLAVGCLGYGGYSGFTCGAGLGWIKTDLFNPKSNKHGLGVYLGAVGTERTSKGSEVISGVGLGYYYFLNGIADGGTNLGLTLVTGNGKYRSGTGVLLQLGYQF